MGDPNSLQFKDINEMILSGMSKEQVVDMINSNTYSGASAIMHFTTWRKV